MRAIKIPKDKLGRVFSEEHIKATLKRLIPKIHFDVGGRLGLDHMYMDYRQAVHVEGIGHICSMDRGGPLGGVIAEVPVWDMVWDLVEIPAYDVTPNDSIAMPLMHRPGWCHVNRQVRGELILCGWHHTMQKLIAKGCTTPEAIGLAFGIDWRDQVEACEVPEEDAAPWDDAETELDGKILEEMGAFVPRPTVDYGSHS